MTSKRDPARKKGAKGVRRSTKTAARSAARKPPVRRNPQPRVWRRVAKLAGDGLAALEAGNLAEVRSCLEAIRAVGLTSQQS